MQDVPARKSNPLTLSNAGYATVNDMKRKSLSDKSIFLRQISSTVSVTLVILIVGIVGSIAIATRRVSDTLKSNIGFTIVMSSEATPGEISDITRALSSDPAIHTFIYTSALDNMRAWNEEIGEDVMKILGANPFPADYTVKVKSPYAATDRLTSVTARYESMPGVDAIDINRAMIDSMQRHISTVIWVLSGIAIALMLISFILINNTVRLTVYSRRFLIHTMKLVGATGSFIRRPFLRSSLISSLIAGAIASLTLGGLVYLLHSRFPATVDILPRGYVAALFPVMIIIAIIICTAASAIATNRYLRMDYDDLF